MSQSKAIQPECQNERTKTGWSGRAFFKRPRSRLIFFVAMSLIGLCILPYLWRSVCVHQIQIATSDRRWDAASLWLSRLHWFNSNSAQALIAHVQLLRKQGDLARAKELLRKAESQGCSRDEVQHEEWLIQAQSGDLSNAEERLLAVVQYERDTAEILDALVQGYLKSGQYLKTMATLDTWQTIEPKSARPLVLRGILFMQLSDWDTSSASLRKALTLQPQAAETELLLAQSLLANKQAEEAVVLFRRCLKALSGREDIVVGLAQALILHGRSAESVELLESFKKNEPHSVPFDLAFGEALLNCGRLENAVEVLQSALSRNGRNVELRHLLGTALRLVGRSAEADDYLASARKARLSLQSADRLRKLVMESPKADEEKLQLARILLENDRVEEATVWLRGLLADHPNHPEARRLLADASLPEVRPNANHSATAGFGRRENLGGTSLTERQPLSSAIIPDAKTNVETAPNWKFTDVTSELAVNFTYRNGRESGHATVVETLGGGVAWIDTDLDGLMDLFLTGGGYFANDRQIKGHSSALFRQNTAQHFERVPQAAGLSDAMVYSHGVSSADYDHDSFPDLLVTGFGGIQFFRNQGDGTFRECAQSVGLSDDRWSTGAGWGDLNNDGNLDLYVAHYLKWNWETHHTCHGPTPDLVDACSPKEFDSEGHFVFLSQGDGTFREASAEVGLRPTGKGLGVVIGDVDLDGDVDLYVGNDTTENFLYVNDGRGRLAEVGSPSGVDVDDHGVMNGSMGVDLGDFDNDGLPDIWVTNYLWESFALYRNLGQQQFQHRSQALGIAAMAGLNVGWGTGFADFDRDGDEDLLATTGHVLLHSPPDRQIPVVLRNESGKRFSRVPFASETYFGSPHHGRGLALADYDNDGDLDVAISHNNEPASILRNDITNPGAWLQVRLIGTSSNRDAIGAWLVLQTSRGSQLRLIKGGGSYLSHSDRRPFWGIPAGTRALRLEIHWPNGSQQTIESPQTNQTLTVIEN